MKLILLWRNWVLPFENYKILVTVIIIVRVRLLSNLWHTSHNHIPNAIPFPLTVWSLRVYMLAKKIYNHSVYAGRILNTYYMCKFGPVFQNGNFNSKKAKFKNVKYCWEFAHVARFLEYDSICLNIILHICHEQTFLFKFKITFFKIFNFCWTHLR